MFFNISVLHLALAFAVGGIWVTLVTRIAEKFGSSVGGVLGGMPSTSALSFFFIGLNQSAPAAVQTTTVFPLAVSFTIFFLLMFALFARRGFLTGLLSSLFIWFLISAVIVIFRPENFFASLVSGLIISGFVYFIFNQQLNLQAFGPNKDDRRTVPQLLARAILAGSIIALAVLCNQVGGPLFGAVFTAFPAMFTSTLIIANQSGGVEFSRSMTKPLALSGILTIIPFSIAVRYLYPSLGIWIGTLASYSIVAPLALLAYRVVNTNENRL